MTEVNSPSCLSYPDPGSLASASSSGDDVNKPKSTESLVHTPLKLAPGSESEHEEPSQSALVHYTPPFTASVADLARTDTNANASALELDPYSLITSPAFPTSSGVKNARLAPEIAEIIAELKSVLLELHNLSTPFFPLRPIFLPLIPA